MRDLTVYGSFSLFHDFLSLGAQVCVVTTSEGWDLVISVGISHVWDGGRRPRCKIYNMIWVFDCSLLDSRLNCCRIGLFVDASGVHKVQTALRR